MGRQKTDPPTALTPAASDPMIAYLFQVVQNLEQTNGRLEAVEKSVDLLKNEVRSYSDTRKTREVWAKRIWENPAFQALLNGFVLVALQAMGAYYIAQKLLAGQSGVP